MSRIYSNKLLSDVSTAVTSATTTDHVIDVSDIAESVRVRNLDENVAREDIERLIIQHAQRLGAAMSLSSGMPKMVSAD